MTNNCLVTKLKEEVSNNNLSIIGELRIVNTVVEGTPLCANNSLRIVANQQLTVKCIGGGNYIQKGTFAADDALPSTGYSNEVTIPALIETTIIFANADCEFSITPKYAITSIYSLGNENYRRNWKFKDLSQFDYCSNLSFIYSFGFKGDGEINFKNVGSVKMLVITNQYEKQTSIAINIETLPADEDYSVIMLNGTRSFGDISIFINKMSLANKKVKGMFNVSVSNVTGEASDIIMALKAGNNYNQTIYGSSEMTLKGQRLMLDGAHTFLSSDNGVTYDVKAGSTVINTYNTNTGTWSN